MVFGKEIVANIERKLTESDYLSIPVLTANNTYTSSVKSKKKGALYFTVQEAAEPSEVGPPCSNRTYFGPAALRAGRRSTSVTVASTGELKIGQQTRGKYPRLAMLSLDIMSYNYDTFRSFCYLQCWKTVTTHPISTVGVAKL